MRREAVRRSLGPILVFALSLGMVSGNPMLIVLGVAVAPLMAAYLLLRRVLSDQELEFTGLIRYAGGIWVSPNLLPFIVLLWERGFGEAGVAVAKSAFWMTVLVASLTMGVWISKSLAVNRLLGIFIAVAGLVLGSSVLVAPHDRVAKCPDSVCMKPLMGFSVTLLGAIERQQVAIHIPEISRPEDDGEQSASAR